jgi:hypothetical protein
MSESCESCAYVAADRSLSVRRIRSGCVPSLNQFAVITSNPQAMLAGIGAHSHVNESAVA